MAAYDNPRFLSNQALYQALVPNAPMDLETFTAGVNQVTKSMIQASAAQMTLEATYLLTGGQDNGED
nr:hypothetical protein [Lacticaseibacillus saniviri]